MRDIKVIEADIAKLQAELADAKDHQSMRDAAVHILKNLGWTYDRGWKKPTTVHKVFNQNTMTHVKAGDWVMYDSGLVGGYGYVRSVADNRVRISPVERVNSRGAIVSERQTTVSSTFVRVIGHEKLFAALAGK